MTMMIHLSNFIIILIFFMVLAMVGVENFIVYSMMYLLLKVSIVYLLVVTPIVEKSF